jgi:hypothetical protein
MSDFVNIEFTLHNLPLNPQFSWQPRYFDFISFAQYVTLTDVVSSPQAVFVEAFNAAGDTRVVRRNVALLPTSQAIMNQFVTDLGDRILVRILETQPTFVSAGAPRDDSHRVLDGIQRIYNYFFQLGYCSVQPVVSRAEKWTDFTVTVVGSCTLWSTKALAKRNAIPNDYDMFATSSYLKACGFKSSARSRTSETTLLREYSIVAEVDRTN